MNKSIVFMFLLLAAIFIAGCVSSPTEPEQLTRQSPPTTQCTADYVKLGVVEHTNQLSDSQAMENCKASCFDKYRLTSYKVELKTVAMPMVGSQNIYTCYCDANDCGGSGVVKTRSG